MDLRPFRGWRFASPHGDVGPFIAPPYDVLSADDKRKLLEACPRNIVAVDLPVVPPKEAGPDEVYRAAADMLRQWMSQGVLTQESQPAIYAYEQSFPWAGHQHTRRALLAGVRATPLGQDVIPHEHTFAGPKADRLKLTQHTRMQLSPIFGFYDDPAGEAVRTAFAGRCCPTVHGQLGPVSEKLWVITEPEVIESVQRTLRSVPVFIADGHHRYTTQLGYRDQLLKDGRIGPDDDANFVLFALVAKDDPGLMILPTHRMIRGLSSDFTLAKLAAAAPEFDWAPLTATPANLADATALLGPLGPHAMGFLAGNEARVATLKDEGAMRKAAAQEAQAWQELDVAILQKLVSEKALAAWKTPEFSIEYTPDGPTVLDACLHGKAQLGAVLQSTPLSAVETIARAGAVMPHKSTYFYPKLATGLVLKPL